MSEHEPRLMLLSDYLALPEQDLMAFWIIDQIQEFNAENVASALSAYEAYGRTGVAQILVDAGFKTNQPVVKIIGLAKAKELLTKMRNNNDFTIFTVDFIKRTTGEFRRMNCRFGVVSAQVGGKKAYSAADHELKTVFDMQKKAFRSIALESIMRMKIHGQKYLIEENMSLADKFAE